MAKLGLVLEGGGMRGAYTAGVLSWFIDQKIEFDFAVGISSGAMHLCNFLAKEPNKLHELSVKWAGSAGNLGIKPFLKEGTFVGYNYMFDEILRHIVPLDLKALSKSKTKAEIGIYDLDVCETIWINTNDIDPEFLLLKAACTLPLAGKAVTYKGKKYLDGGITTMIPISRSVHHGCKKHIVITTKPEGYVRKPAGPAFNSLTYAAYYKYPKLRQDLKDRSDVYYREVSIIEKLKQEGDCLSLFPSVDLGIGRFAGDCDKLEELYQLGRNDCEQRKEEILSYIKQSKK